MSFHVLSPEVAGGLGERSQLDTTVHPPRVYRLHYEVQGWSGDELLESFPCYLVSPALAAQLSSADLTGAQFADVEVTISSGAEDWVDPAVLQFRWLQVSGTPGNDDLGVDETARLIVSDQALDAMRRHSLDKCLVERSH